MGKQYKNHGAQTPEERRIAIRKRILNLMLSGKWTPGAVLRISEDYSLSIEQTKCLAEEAKSILSYLEDTSGGLEGVRDEVSGVLRRIIKKSFSRTGWGEGETRKLPDDLKSATAAATLLAKLNGLLVERSEVTTYDVVAALSSLTDEQRRYIETTGTLPPGVSLPGVSVRGALTSSGTVGTEEYIQSGDGGVPDPEKTGKNG
jgi:hypothetical protein